VGEEERTASTPVGAEAAGDGQPGDAQADDQGPRDPQEIRRDIEETRRELGDTVAAVAEKADVKAQAHAKVDDVKAQAQSKVDDVKARVTGKKDEFSDRAKQAAPESSGQAAEQAKTFLQQNRTAVIIGGAILAGFLFGRVTGR
jgi:ElaB/YqjD/DUF883 family membrane-anchored ribosome-binding protein